MRILSLGKVDNTLDIFYSKDRLVAKLITFTIPPRKSGRNKSLLFLLKNRRVQCWIPFFKWGQFPPEKETKFLLGFHFGPNNIGQLFDEQYMAIIRPSTSSDYSTNTIWQLFHQEKLAKTNLSAGGKENFFFWVFILAPTISGSYSTKKISQEQIFPPEEVEISIELLF